MATRLDKGGMGIRHLRDFIATARACRSQTDRMFAALYHEKPALQRELIAARLRRLYSLYAAQVKQPA